MHACAGLVGAAGEDGDGSGIRRGPEQGRDVASAGVEEGKEDLSTVVIRLREASASTYAGAKRAGAANGDRIGAGQVGEVQWEPKAGQRDVSATLDAHTAALDAQAQQLAAISDKIDSIFQSAQTQRMPQDGAQGGRGREVRGAAPAEGGAEADRYHEQQFAVVQALRAENAWLKDQLSAAQDSLSAETPLSLGLEVSATDAETHAHAHRQKMAGPAQADRRRQMRSSSSPLQSPRAARKSDLVMVGASSRSTTDLSSLRAVNLARNLASSANTKRERTRQRASVHHDVSRGCVSYGLRVCVLYCDCPCFGVSDCGQRPCLLPANIPVHIYSVKCLLGRLLHTVLTSHGFHLLRDR